MEQRNYNIGLDIGVGSVGWCVTDENNTILKRNGKNMWGATIFEEAQTAKSTREYRGARRRLDRRRERINILQSLIKEDIEEDYPNFLPMLRETSKIEADKTISESILGKKYNLFSDENTTDEKYYKKYPTIYHLRKYLMEETEKVDIRLVYLAIHHIIKYRGNFLYDGDFANDTTAIEENLDVVLSFLEERCGIKLREDKKTIIETLKIQNKSKSQKKDILISLFDYEKENKQLVVNMVNSMIGYAFELKNIFNIDIEKTKITFSSEIENEEEIKNALGEDAKIYESMNSIYSWFILQDILNGEEYISKAFTKKYDKYNQDLKLLKQIYKTYFKESYKSMFRIVGQDNYVAYNGKNQGKECKKCGEEKFFIALKKQIEKLPDECEDKLKILDEIKDNNFLRKLNVTDNGAIPHQLHKKELEKIIENQCKYYRTLLENKDKIMELFSFRIPYYIGPLSRKEEGWSWIVRKSDEKIRPWNFSEVIDKDATAEKFIRRMTNKCTYIINEDVLPKQSLLYSRFCVLNELNNIRVDGHRLSKDTKRNIINDLFKKNKKVTLNQLKKFYEIQGLPKVNIEGLQETGCFMSSMSSYIDMNRILGEIDESNYEQCEKLIYWITIFEDKKMLKHKIEKEYGEKSLCSDNLKLNENQIRELVKKRYTGWARLSKRLLTGLKANDGETIIEKLENTPLNFMKIINEKEFGFDRQLEELMPKVSKEIKYSDIEDIPTSPANKRAIWKSMCIVKEITQIMKHEPKNIYIEFARGEEKKVMKDNRAKELLKKYEEISKQIKYVKDYDSKVYEQLKAHQNDKILNEKLYLYFIQNGKCLYSGRPLDIDNLSLYEVDHIMPQSYIVDNSIDNKALVLKGENQRKADSLLLSDDIIDKQKEWWKSLLDSNLISQNKYYRLIKRKMFETDEDREKFVKRQLVETRQITKYVTNLLKNKFESTDIFTIRGELTSLFREKYKFYKNRNVNNYHHAQDAYIISVIANILDKNWKGIEQFKYAEYVKKYFKDERSKYQKNGIIINTINKYLDIEKVRRTMNYKDCYITKMLIENTGEFYNQTLYSPTDKNNKPVIRLKEDLPAETYGGYSGENKAYFVVFSYINKKGNKEYQLTGIPVKTAYDVKLGKITIEEYIRTSYLKDIEYSDFNIERNHILKNQQYLDENNELMRLCSDTEIRPDKELILSYDMNELVYLINLPEDRLDDEEKRKVQDGYEKLFDYLICKIEKEYKSLAKSGDKIKSKKDVFLELSDLDKKSVINLIIDMMQTRRVDLKLLKLGSGEGRMAGKNFNTSKLLNMIFIDKSITGMYERRYKVNGMENSSSK